MKISVKAYLIFLTNATEKKSSICCWYFLFELQQANKKAQSL